MTTEHAPGRTLSDTLTLYLRDRPELTTPHISKLRTSVAKFNGLMEPCSIDEINPPMLQDFREKLLDGGLSDATVDGYLRAVGRVVNHSADARLQLSSRIEQWNPTTPEQLGEIWQKTRFATWPFLCSGHSSACWFGVPPPVWWRAVLMITYSTGLSRTDLTGLRWSDIGPDRLRTRPRMNAPSKHLPIPEPLQPWLDVLRTLESETVIGLPFGEGTNNGIASAAHHGISTATLRAIRRAAWTAFETAVPEAGWLLQTGRTFTRSGRPRFEVLQEATSKLIYPPEFLEPPPAAYLTEQSPRAKSPRITQLDRRHPIRTHTRRRRRRRRAVASA